MVLRVQGTPVQVHRDRETDWMGIGRHGCHTSVDDIHLVQYSEYDYRIKKVLGVLYSSTVTTYILKKCMMHDSSASMRLPRG